MADGGGKLQRRGGGVDGQSQEHQPTRAGKRKARDECPKVQVIMDDQFMIPGSTYASWLQDPSSHTSRRLVSNVIDPLKTFKISDLLKMPPSALMLCSADKQEVSYPPQLLHSRRFRRTTSALNSASTDRARKEKGGRKKMADGGGKLQLQEDGQSQEQQPTRAGKRKARDECPKVQVIMDDQFMIPGSTYASWLQDPSSHTSRRLVSNVIDPLKTFKISDLLQMPPSALMLCSADKQEVSYPQQLLHSRRARK